MKKLIVSIILILSMSAISVFAENGVFTLSASDTEKGEEFDVVLSISQVPASVGSVTVEYDSNMMEFVSSQFSDNMSGVSTFINPEYEKNQIRFNWLTLEENIDFTDFLNLKFKANRAGKAKISVIECDLYDISENPIEVSYSPIQINISGTNDDVIYDDIINNENTGKGNSGTSTGKKPASTNTDKRTEDEDVEKTETIPTTVVKFSDISGFNWAEEAITELNKLDIIRGVSENEFAPSAMIKRADFMCLLIRMLDNEIDFSENFSDVSKDKYYYSELGKAKVLGITQGVGDNMFLPENNISRQEMFTLVHRFLSVKEFKLDEAQIDELRHFEDYGHIKDYALVPVATLVKNGFVSGADGKIMPEKNATRAETAVLIYRLYNFINK